MESLLKEGQNSVLGFQFYSVIFKSLNTVNIFMILSMYILMKHVKKSSIICLVLVCFLFLFTVSYKTQKRKINKQILQGMISVIWE